MTALLQALDAGVFTLTLNRPAHRNALNAELIEALHQALDRAELDASVRVVALRGAGGNFCVGADLEQLLASADGTLADNEGSARRLGLLFQRCRQLPKPVVAIVHGQAVADGAALATACDVAIAAESATIGYPEIQHGFVPALAVPLLRRLAGEKLALELVLTGRLLSARDAASAGLVTRVFPDAALGAEVTAFLNILTEASGTALALTKRLFYQLDGLPLAVGLALGAQTDALARGAPDFRDILTRYLRR